MDRLRRKVVGGWRIRLNGTFVDWRWHGSREDRRVRGGASARGRDRVGSLATVATMRELVVMKATCQFGLFQMVGNVLIGHFLEPSLKEIDFLREAISKTVSCYSWSSHTSSSFQALPPPVEAGLRFFWTP